MTSPDRLPFVVGNWKTGPAHATLLELTSQLVAAAEPLRTRRLELAICPPYPWLAAIAGALEGSEIRLAAQDVAASDRGSATGEVSADMLRGLCTYTLVGHYERRILLHERDGEVRKKVQAALSAGIRPILCVGESAEALEDGLGPSVVLEQVEASLADLELSSDLVVAYAPSWTTIGRIMPPGEAYANEICGVIRETLEDMASASLAQSVRILYGGRMGDANLAELAAQPEIDGLLIGSGATNAERFTGFAAAFG